MDSDRSCSDSWGFRMSDGPPTGFSGKSSFFFFPDVRAAELRGTRRSPHGGSAPVPEQRGVPAPGLESSNRDSGAPSLDRQLLLFPSTFRQTPATVIEAATWLSRYPFFGLGGRGLRDAQGK